MKKPMLCCCFTWIVFIEINFTVAFLLMRKTCDYQFAGKVGGWGILRNGGGILVTGGMILKWGYWYPSVFCLFTLPPSKNQKNQNFENMEKLLEISSLYIYIPKTTWGMRYGSWDKDWDRQNFCHSGPFSPLKIKILNEKRL